jgi:hypothetical protein
VIPLSLRIARLLLFAAAFFAVASALYIGVLSSDRLRALPWLVLFLLSAAGFAEAWRRIGRDAPGARRWAIAAAILLAAVGTVTGLGAGNITFPAAGVGALAAWAAVLHPPKRRVAVAFAVYLAIGIAINAGRLGLAFLYPWIVATVLIWPITLLFLLGLLLPR